MYKIMLLSLLTEDLFVSGRVLRDLFLFGPA